MSKQCERIRDGSYGFTAPNLCGRVGPVAMAVPRQSCADDSETVAMAGPRQSCADSWDSSYGCAAPKLCGRFGDCNYGCASPKLCRRIETVAKALRCQSSALLSELTRRPRLRLALS